MIVKFFSSRNGGGTASIDYLLNKKRIQDKTAKILQGDEKLTRELIKSMSQKHKVCVGCLSFEEKNIDEALKKELMNSFENMLLTPEMQGRYNILWVEHTDKNRLELNFVIPKIDLKSKKAFNPYFHMADYKRKDFWTDFINLSYGFTNPKDPAKENTLQGSKKEYELIKDYEALDIFLHNQVAQGNITSRNNLISLLKTYNVEVTREGKDYISVKLPENKKAKRFKGGIYDEEFTSPRELEGILERIKQRERAFNERDNRAELERVKQELDKLIQSKTRYYYERNSKRALQDKQNTPSVQVEQSINEFSNGIYYNNDFKHDNMVSVDKTLSNQQGFDDKERGQYLSVDTKGIDETRTKSLLFQTELERIEYDNIRTRINSRNRELTERIRKCIDTNREHSTEKQRIIARTLYINNSLSKLRDFIQEQFRDYRKRVKRKIKQLLEKENKKTRNRGERFYR